MNRNLLAIVALAACALAYAAGPARSSGPRDWLDRWEVDEEEELTRIAPVYLKIAPTNNLTFTQFENPRAAEGYTFYMTGFISPRGHELRYPPGVGLDDLRLTFGGEPQIGALGSPLPIETSILVRSLVGSAFGGTQSTVLVGFYDLTPPSIETLVPVR